MGDNLKMLRKLFHLTQKALGDQIGVSQGVVSEWEKESNAAYPTADKLIELAKFFGVSVDCILDLVPIPAGYPNHQRPASGSASSPTSTPELQTSTHASTDFQSRIPAARTAAPSLLQNEKEQPEPSQTAPADPSAAPAPFSADQLAFLDDRLDQQGQLLDQRLDQFKYDLLEAIREDMSSLSEKKHG